MSKLWPKYENWSKLGKQNIMYRYTPNMYRYMLGSGGVYRYTFKVYRYMSPENAQNVYFFFFFWINKNLFPKGQSPTKNTHEVKKDPKKNEKRTAPPLKQRKRGIRPNKNTPDKHKPITHIRVQPTQTTKQN